MNILELNFEREWRGGERQTLYNMQGFRNAGLTVHLIARSESALSKKAKQDDFIVHEFDGIGGVIIFLITNGKQYDFIHAQTSHILTYCVFTKLFHRQKVIFTRRVNFAQKGFFTRLKYQYTDKIIAISEAIKKTLIQFTQRKDIDVITDVVVQADVNEAAVKKAYAPLNPDGKHIIGVVAALTIEKDPFTMLDAVKKLSTLRNDFVMLHFGDGNMKDAVEKKIAELQLQDAYRLMGFKENIDVFIPGFEVMATSSTEEGLGSSVLDAFINKVPVVATNAGGLNELLQDGRGVLCNIKDSSAIADGINLLLNDTNKRNTCIQNAFQYVNEAHGMELLTKKYLAVMHQMNPGIN